MEIALALIQKEKSFLLIERIKKEKHLTWAFPGGKVERSDFSPKHTAMREAQEEVGIVCTPVRYLGTKHGTITIHYYLCHYFSGEILCDSDEVGQCRWCLSDEVFFLFDSSEIFPPVRELLEGCR